MSLGADGHICRDRVSARVARRDIETADRWTLGQLPSDGMLASAVADYEDIHFGCVLLTSLPEEGSTICVPSVFLSFLLATSWQAAAPQRGAISSRGAHRDERHISHFIRRAVESALIKLSSVARRSPQSGRRGECRARGNTSLSGIFSFRIGISKRLWKSYTLSARRETADTKSSLDTALSCEGTG